MKNLIAASTLLLLFTTANGNPPPARPPAPTVAVAGGDSTPTAAETVERYVDRVEDAGFRGCDRSASVLDGTDNTGGGAGGSGALRRGPGGGQR